MSQKFDGSLNGEKCYVATCVYGSYDCPEVWTLRRFRDNTLATTGLGRQTICIYYAVSPKLVDMFGRKAWFHRMWSPVIARIVARLQAGGVSNAPYADDR